MRRPSPAGLALAALLAAAPAAANGLVTHVWVADQAIDRVAPGPLRDLLADPTLRGIVRNGAIYPDSGYSVDHPYGEWAHWESLVEPYLQWVRQRYGAEGYASVEARRHVAFLLGAGAHGMTDQTFDMLFMARSRQYDGNVDDLDIGADAWLIVERGVGPAPDGVFDFDALPGIHRDIMGPAVTPEILRNAAGRTAAATRLLGRLAAGIYRDHWVRMPWAGSHYLDPDTPGSYPVLVGAVAGYYTALWDRLHDRARSDAPPLVTWPVDGATNLPVDPDDVGTRATMVFPIGIDRASLTTDHLRIVTETGEAVPARVSRYGDDGNTVMVRPTNPLAYNTAYRVEATTGLRLRTGVPLGRTVSVRFRTRCAPDRPADCPPLPAPFVAPADPPVRDPAEAVRTRDAGAPVGPIVMVDDDAGTAPDAATTPDTNPGGCGCATAPSPHGAAPATLLLTLGSLLHARRRRARASTARVKSG